MGTAFATLTEEDGVVARQADVNGFALAELRFPPGYVQPAFEPERPYLAFVLEGELTKSFGTRRLALGRSTGVTIPAGATHAARFGSRGASIVIVKPRDQATGLAGCLDRVGEVRDHGSSWVAWRLAAELRLDDRAAPLAAEGWALELLAATSRDRTARHIGPNEEWLRCAEELLRDRHADCLRLGELADAVGVEPARLARCFRARHGVSVGEYGRRLRLAWAATELAGTDTPLATVATDAGFADQSHFTRLFRGYAGMTPARYRAATRGTVFQPFQSRSVRSRRAAPPA